MWLIYFVQNDFTICRCRTLGQKISQFICPVPPTIITPCIIDSWLIRPRIAFIWTSFAASFLILNCFYHCHSLSSYYPCPILTRLHSYRASSPRKSRTDKPAMVPLTVYWECKPSTNLSYWIQIWWSMSARFCFPRWLSVGCHSLTLKILIYSAAGIGAVRNMFGPRHWRSWASCVKLFLSWSFGASKLMSSTMSPSKMTPSNREQPVKLLALGKCSGFYSFADGLTDWWPLNRWRRHSWTFWAANYQRSYA